MVINYSGSIEEMKVVHVPAPDIRTDQIVSVSGAGDWLVILYLAYYAVIAIRIPSSK